MHINLYIYIYIYLHLNIRFYFKASLHPCMRRKMHPCTHVAGFDPAATIKIPSVHLELKTFEYTGVKTIGGSRTSGQVTTTDPKLLLINGMINDK